MSELGDILRSAREGKNVHLTEAAQATRIKLAYLEALESGHYAALPGPAYVTGFLRIYASYLGLPTDDVVQEYHASRPQVQPTVRAATRVLASHQERDARKRLLWVLAGVVLLLASGFAIKQYNDASAHAYTPLNVTPSNLGATVTQAHIARHPHAVTLRLHATAPVWVRVTADGRRVFEGSLRPVKGGKRWTASHTIYVVTYDGSHLRAIYNGHRLGRLAPRPGLMVTVATPSAWRHVS